MEISQPLTISISQNKKLLGLAVTAALVLIGSAFWSLALTGAILGACLAVGFLFNRTLRLSIFLFTLFFENFFQRKVGVDFNVAGLHLMPMDLMAGLLALSVLLKQIMSGRKIWERTGLEMPIALFIASLAVSLIRALNLWAGIVGLGHICFYFMAFYALVVDWREVPVQKLWRIYLWLGGIALVPALWGFFESGGGRSLGFSGLNLPHLILPIVCFELVSITLFGGVWRWLFTLTLFLTIVASQTRGIWITLALVILAWPFVGYFLRQKISMGLRMRRIALSFLVLALLVTVLQFFVSPFLGTVEERAGQVVAQSGTVYLRLFLWGLALKLFWANPLLGVGLGQFASAVEQLPEMKNLPVFELTRGLSAHNLMLSFLAESGIVGVTTLVILFGVVLRRAWKAIHQARTLEVAGFGWGLFLALFSIVVSSVYAGTWGYQFMFFLALLIIFERQLKASHPRENAS